MPTMNGDIDARIQQSVKTCYESLLKRGELLTRQQLAGCYSRFCDRFGPDRLRKLDGETLLNTMHAHGGRDSLVYWLEFKSDDEFPTRQFGSIAGGTALKFGLYKSKDSGKWTAGDSKNQTTLTVDEAVAVARRHRDQLLAAAGVLESLPIGADDEAYAALQEKLAGVAPDVSRLAWGHKYLSLLFPDRLDDYHSKDWQRHNLLKLLQLPPEHPGLYVPAGRFVRLAALMGWPINHLTATLNDRNGSPANYWRIGTKGDEDQDIWQDMKAGGYAAIGWAKLGDLSSVLAGDDAREKIAASLTKDYSSNNSVASRKAGEIRNFAEVMAENDVILAADGERIIGVGRLKGSYRFDPTPPVDAPHRRDVEWLSTAEWKLPVSEGLQTTVWQLKKDDRNLLAAEKQMLEPAAVIPPPDPEQFYSPESALNGLFVPQDQFQAMINALHLKKNVILQGPPGVGKTFIAKRLAYALLKAKDPSRVEMVQFHASYSYEDFIQGWRPSANGSFQLRNGVFYEFCNRARSDTRDYVFIIDEINRGNLGKIFGELMMLMETDKRGSEYAIPLPYSEAGERFSVPGNVHLLGLMNTADRSLAMVDYALRRRFRFFDLRPQFEHPAFVEQLRARGASDQLIQVIVRKMADLNAKIESDHKNLGRGFAIGHSFFCISAEGIVADEGWYRSVVEHEIAPLIEEYWFDRPETARKWIEDIRSI